MLPGITPSLFSSKVASAPPFSSPVTPFNSTPNVLLTGVPAGARKVDVNVWAMAGSATDVHRVRLGSGGVVATAGYDSMGANTVPTIAFTASTVAFDTTAYIANDVLTGRTLMTLLDPATNQWVVSTRLGSRINTRCYLGCGSVTLPGVLDRIQVGANTANVTAGSTSFVADSSPVISTPVALSGTSVTLAGIPSNAKQVILSITALQLSATDQIRIRIGPSSGVATSGYDAEALNIPPTQSHVDGTVGFDTVAYGAFLWSAGHFVLTLADPATNTWVADWVMTSRASSGALPTVTGSITLSGPLERISIGTAAGAATLSGKAGYMVLP